MYVLGGIHIPIVMDAALGTRPGSNIESKGVQDMPTLETALGRGVPLVNLDQVAPIPSRFVGELGDELRPAHVRDGLGQLGVLHHVLDGQRLHADRLVFTNQAGGELVQEVTASISYPGMDASHLLSGLGSVLRALVLLGKPALSLGKFLPIFVEKLWVANGLSSGEDHEVFQAQISPDGRLNGIKLLDLLFYQQRDEIAISTVFCHGDGRRSTSLGQGTRPNDRKWLGHFGERERASIPPEGGIDIGSRLLLAFLFVGGIFRTSLKKGDEGFIEMPQGLLQRHRRHIREPDSRFLLFELGQQGTDFLVGEAMTVLVVGIGFLAQRPIVDKATTAKGVGKQTPLFISWVKAILVRSLLFHR